MTMNSARRIVVSILITGFWLVMMGLLARDFLLPGRDEMQLVDLSSSLLTEEWRDYEEWMHLQVGARSKGVSYTTIRRYRPTGGYVACNRIWLDVEVFGGKFPFRLETVALLDAVFQLSRARATVQIDEAEMEFVALATPTRLYYRWEFEDRMRAGSQPLDEPISLLEAVRPLVTRRFDLVEGKVYRLPVLDSTWSLREGVAELRVEERETIEVGDDSSVEAFRLVIQMGPIASTAWVSPDGEILRREFPHAITMERTDPEKAREHYPDIDAPVAPPVVRPSDFPRGEGGDEALATDAGPLSLLVDLFRSPADR